MSDRLEAHLAHARWLPAAERTALGDELAVTRPEGTVLLTTCHRVEMYGTSASLARVREATQGRARVIAGDDVIRHVVRLAVGRESAVVAEDQVLHQLRLAVSDGRDRGGLPTELDRLFDLALRAGRRARSWLPAARPSLADVALEMVLLGDDLSAAPALVVGTGEMGRHAAANLLGRGAHVHVSSRTVESGRAVAERLGATHVDFDPGADLAARLKVVVVALAGPWLIGAQTRRALGHGAARVIDISAPPALDADIAGALAGRLTTIDDLAETPMAAGRPSHRLINRLEELVRATIAEYDHWTAGEARRRAADALARRAQAVQAAELDRLWDRVPALDEQERTEVERALRGLADQLLRDPLEQLSHDHDGRHARAARELFRL